MNGIKCLISQRIKDKNAVIKKYETDEWAYVVKRLNTLNYRLKERARYRITPESLRLAEKIERDIGIKVFPAVVRCYPGSYRDAGAWVCAFYDELASGNIGSGVAASELLKPKYKLVTYTHHGDIEIIPEEKEARSNV